MTFEKLAKEFTLNDVCGLVAEFYPDKIEYLLVFEEVFLITQENNKYTDHKLTVRIEDDEVFLYMLSGQKSLYFLLSGVSKAKINYMTMEMFSDEEIFIRILHAIVFKGYEESARQLIIKEKEQGLNLVIKEKYCYNNNVLNEKGEEKMSKWKIFRVCLDWIIKLVLIVGLVFCLNVISHQDNQIEDQQTTITELQANAVAQNEVLSSLAATTDGYNSQFETIAEVLKENQVDKDALVSEVLTNVNAPSQEDLDKTNALLAQQVAHITNQLQELSNDNDATLAQVEAAVSNALVSLSKPTPNVIKPMPNVQPVTTSVAISNAQKEGLVSQVKGEIFVDFEKAGYGDFQDGKFVLKEAFFGAILDPDQEWVFEPIEE